MHSCLYVRVDARNAVLSHKGEICAPSIIRDETFRMRVSVSKKRASERRVVNGTASAAGLQVSRAQLRVCLYACERAEPRAQCLEQRAGLHSLSITYRVPVRYRGGREGGDIRWSASYVRRCLSTSTMSVRKLRRRPVSSFADRARFDSAGACVSSVVGLESTDREGGGGLVRR